LTIRHGRARAIALPKTVAVRHPSSPPERSQARRALRAAWRRRRLYLPEEELNAMRAIDDVIDRLRAEFLEMPGMRLTREQVQRLCGLEHTVCQAVLDSLVDVNFLCVSPDGRYARATDGQAGPVRAAKAGIRPHNERRTA
jgi:hypothetical protein